MNTAFHGLLYVIVFGGPAVLVWAVYRKDRRA